MHLIAKTRKTMGSVAALTAALMLAGCSGGKTEYRELSDARELEHMQAEEHEHHHEQGPHGGHLLELGAHHGEITLADHQLTLYILGEDAKTPAPLEKAQVIVQLEVEGTPVDVKLGPEPMAGEQQGSSRYVSPPGSIPESIADIEQVHGSVRLTVGGKETVATIAHDHEHHDH